MRIVSIVSALAASFLVLACSGSSPDPLTGPAAPGANGGDAGPVVNGADASGGVTPGTGGNGSDGGDVGQPDAAPATGAYPAGPYGTAVGSVIANLSWVGYVNPTADAVSTTKPYGAYSLDDARRSGKRYAMINVAESMCPGCQKSARELKTDGKSVVDAGGVVIEVLETTGFTTQPTKSDLDAWINKYGIPVTTVKDPDGTGTATLTALGPREHAYIVDLSTMKIVQFITGDNTGFGATSGGKATAAMLKLLGK